MPLRLKREPCLTGDLDCVKCVLLHIAWRMDEEGCGHKEAGARLVSGIFYNANDDMDWTWCMKSGKLY